ncbi:MAG TPA: tetratricopeptide repeat protein, partial [Myxococcales bacterium]|nr:tetratricopeptide repeat protein [Myxococcales bacterium]
VESALDEYGKEWVAMHTDACEATRLRGEQTEDVLSLRMICLDRRLVSLGALAKVFMAADQKTVEKSLDAALALPKMRGCADVEALKSPTPLPEDPKTRAKVDEIERTLAEAKALMDSGNLTRSLELAEGAAREARVTGYKPVMAEALHLDGWALARLQKGEALKRGEELLQQAVAAAEEGRLDPEKARALTKLVYAAGYMEGNATQAALWQRLAEAAVKRVGSAELEADLLNNMGNVYLRHGRLAEGAATLAKAAELASREWGEADPRTNIILANWASALKGINKPDEALTVITRSLAALEKTRGADNPTAASQRRVLGLVYLDLKDYRHAYDELQRAIKIHTASLGPESLEVAADLDWLAVTLQSDGLYAEALEEAQRSLKIREKVLPSTSMILALSLENIGQAQLSLRKPLDAIPNLEKAVGLYDRNGQEPSESAEARFALARALWDGNRDRRRAVALAEQARSGYEAKKDTEHVRGVTEWQQAHAPGALKGGSRR